MSAEKIEANNPNESDTSMPNSEAAGWDSRQRVPERELLGIPFAMLDMASVARVLGARPAIREFAYVATPNAQHLVLLHRRVEGFQIGLSRAWFLICDSRVLRLMGQLLFGRSVPVVTGSDLTTYLLRHVINADDPVTVIGGSDQLRRDLADQFGLRRVALYSPPYGFSRDREQLQRCIDFVRAHPARFVFLACGAPQSEVLAATLVEAGGISGIGLCIGASLLFATGRLKRAPRAIQALCLEWLYRLTQERSRLSSRLWHAQLPVLLIAAKARMTRRLGSSHTSLLDRPHSQLPPGLTPVRSPSTNHLPPLISRPHRQPAAATQTPDFS